MTQKAFSALAAGIFALLLSFPGNTEDLKVPILEITAGNLDTCAYGQVTGLKTGEFSFLAVRSGPGTFFKKIDELHNGDKVWFFDQRGDWLGVLYGIENVSCGPIKKSRIVPHQGRKGWVHQDWVALIAG